MCNSYIQLHVEMEVLEYLLDISNIYSLSLSILYMVMYNNDMKCLNTVKIEVPE